ncbi:hypothetical protein PIIN_11127 [Serendipita indica DSM 11827]|uniref:Secreted protein n=1 Tax=Serendipita indica (strain DSM 11827) TaxID=1109443 RepID=G4U0Q1_SERID|nr:hypothetical protein PIIN_11127 [Serendipita indica DSM 11827]
MFVLLATLTAVQQVTQFAVLHLKSAVLRVHSASAHVPAAKLRKQPAVKSAVLVEQLAAIALAVTLDIHAPHRAKGLSGL